SAESLPEPFVAVLATMPCVSATPASPQAAFAISPWSCCESAAGYVLIGVAAPAFAASRAHRVSSDALLIAGCPHAAAARSGDSSDRISPDGGRGYPCRAGCCSG